MALSLSSSPHLATRRSTSHIMFEVTLATLPAVGVISYFFGFGTLFNILSACSFALLVEAIILYIRKRPILHYLKDGSAIVTALLLAISLPPYAPTWLVCLGVATAILVAKHLYGGLGYNPFNPAMVGYAALLISCPVEMTRWAAPRGTVADKEPIGFIEAVQQNLLLQQDIDAVTMATPLDVVKNASEQSTLLLWQQNPQFGQWAGIGWEWVNIAFLIGGLWLLYRRVFSWHAPIAMLLMLTGLATVFYYGDNTQSTGSPAFHLLSGATMLGAFFIVTDPVTSAVSIKGRLIYGALIGFLLYVIRVWGNYPDAIAFAVLLANFTAPLIDHFSQPRVIGHDG